MAGSPSCRRLAERGSSARYDAARHNLDEAKIRERQLEHRRPKFGKAPQPPKRGTPAQEAAKDAAYRQRVEQRQARKQQRTESETRQLRKDGPTLGR